MFYWGKILGLFWGLLSGSSLWSILIGILIGHIFDKTRCPDNQYTTFDQQKRQSLFFQTTFQVLGHLTKSKGRVTDKDIEIASNLMDRMKLHGDSRQEAQRAFREGKKIDYPIRDKLRELRMSSSGRFDLLRMFLEIQIQAAFADGLLHPNEREILYVIAEELGISYTQFEQFIQMMESGKQFSHTYYNDNNSHYEEKCHPDKKSPTLKDACTMLGVSINDDFTIIKRAYRKRMSEHHPDKLVAKGLPPEMMEMAKQKTQAIQEAYDLIKREKGFK
ncbi:co-chaperone DjlA [Candidatus Erwinia haradaeae]|uniref:Co-chaperone protein DjlA n=1 Tax=Candidatus Erwinia haradaeae TaxID=1922217 RepID=A0A803FUH4_9GAMM|nr:co-chaperone DjlA [Candidatus Erwinia haradaeae]VFP88804.1 Co-chaperone protein DjlA [Candidatus Erwinia haradaeae]